MTTSLRRLLEQEAQRTTRSPAPLGDVMSGGASLVRRRRFVGVGVVAAVAALASVVVPGVVDRTGDGAPVADQPGRWVGAWADAESLHFGAVEAPRPEHLYEMAAGTNGMLYIDWDWSRGAPKSTVFWLGSDGDVRQIGQAAFAQPEVVGTTAAWFEDPDGDNGIRGVRDDYTLVVYDTRRMREVVRLPGVTAADGWSPPILGISGSRIYYETELPSGSDSAYWSWDWKSGDAPTKVDVPWLMDVSSGVRAEGTGPDRFEGDRFTDEDGDLIATADGLAPVGRLSVDGHYFLARDEDGWVVARTDGSERVSLELDGWHLSRVAGWDRSGRVTVLAARSDDPGLETDGDSFGNAEASVVACSPVDGSCEVVAEDVGQGKDLLLADLVEESYVPGR
jgi:hypothetical protein